MLALKALFASRVESNQEFLNHVATYGISYGTQEEYLFRQEIFNTKSAQYAEINADPKNTFTVGHNFMSTWTAQEYKNALGLKDIPKNQTFVTLSTENTPAAIDWRSLGAVNPTVKNQGQCQSCWAFSATASIESAQKIQKGGDLLSLSEQQIISCADPKYGCRGGSPEIGMTYVQQHGQVTEAEYPYTAAHGQTGICKQNMGTPSAYVASYNHVKSRSVDQLLAALTKQPVSVLVQANQAVFGGYKGGIMNSPECGQALDHAINAVGFGNEDGQTYYIVRNSWGPTWGEAGYIRIAAVEGTGICGITRNSPVWPTMK